MASTRPVGGLPAGRAGGVPRREITRASAHHHGAGRRCAPGHDARHAILTVRPGRAADGARARAAAADAPPPAPAAGAGAAGGAPRLLYAGVALDMDGTLTVSNIDYATMRRTIDVPEGDLFTMLDSAETSGARVRAAMDAILEIEAAASAALSLQPGLQELLGLLAASGARVGLVTRNTTEAVDAFFAAAGERWRPLFDPVLTRDTFPYCKPDVRVLEAFAAAWGAPPARLLMVGDSPEDVECGNAAGFATCLVAGGGNEVGAAAAAAPAAAPRGAAPTFRVADLRELRARLEARDTALGWPAYTDALAAHLSSSSESDGGGGDGRGVALRTVYGSEVSESDADGLPPYGPGGLPAPGAGFLAALAAAGALPAEPASFPRIYASASDSDADDAGAGAPLAEQHPGARVLHLGCGAGGLTKLLASSGFRAVGADAAAEAAAARKKGLLAVAVPADVGAPGALDAAVAAAGGGRFDAALLRLAPACAPPGGVAQAAFTPAGVAELRRVLAPGGRLCVELPAARLAAAEALLAADGGWAPAEAAPLEAEPGADPAVCLVAVRLP